MRSKHETGDRTRSTEFSGAPFETSEKPNSNYKHAHRGWEERRLRGEEAEGRLSERTACLAHEGQVHGPGCVLPELPEETGLLIRGSLFICGPLTKSKSNKEATEKSKPKQATHLL